VRGDSLGWLAGKVAGKPNRGASAGSPKETMRLMPAGNQRRVARTASCSQKLAVLGAGDAPWCTGYACGRGDPSLRQVLAMAAGRQLRRSTKTYRDGKRLPQVKGSRRGQLLFCSGYATSLKVNELIRILTRLHTEAYVG
jgi:hypothetical protein